MKDRDKTYSIHDGTIGIWREIPHISNPLSLDEIIRRSKHPLSKWEKEAEQQENLRIARENERMRNEVFAECDDFYMDLRGVLMNAGWRIQIDKRVHQTIRHHYHVGQYRDICLKANLSGRCIEFKFYEPVIRDNPNGGEYHFDKMQKMPYLKRLRVLVALGHLTTFLKEQGYTDRSKTIPERGIEAIMQHRKELEDFQGADFYKRERQTYNVFDADKVEMFDGDVRYFWDYHGNLHRGVVYRHINNMWWVHTGPYSYSNIANWQLFTWKPEMGRRKHYSAEEIQKRLKAQLDKSIKSENFERAIVLRNVLRGQAA